MKKILYIIALSACIISCSTSKKATVESKSATPAPAGYEFEKVEYSNNPLLASINMPVSGNKFSKKASASVNSPGNIYKFGSAQLLVFAPVNKDFAGTLDEQIAKIRSEKYFGPRMAALRLTDNEYNINIEKSAIAGKEVARVEISTKLIQGWGSLYYGYFVQHEDKTLFVCIKDIQITPDITLEANLKALDDAFKYIIETVEFI